MERVFKRCNFFPLPPPLVLPLSFEQTSTRRGGGKEEEEKEKGYTRLSRRITLARSLLLSSLFSEFLLRL